MFLVGFLLVTLFRNSFLQVDVAVNLWIPSIQSSTFTFFAEGVSLIFDTTSLVVFSLVFSGFLFLKNYKPQGLLLLGAMGSDALLVSVIKTLEQVDRPMNGLIPSTGFSYPSGHSTGCIVLGVVLAYFAWQRWKSSGSKVLIVTVLGLLTFVVGFDRIYLNVHWVSDVFGGWLLGAFWVSFSILVFQRLKTAGKFESERFGFVARLFYFGVVFIAIFVILLGLLGSYLSF